MSLLPRLEQMTLLCTSMASCTDYKHPIYHNIFACCLQVFLSLVQGSVNYSQKAKYSTTTCFTNKVLLKHRHSCSFPYCLCLCTTTAYAELNSHHKSCKAENTYHLALHRKFANPTTRLCAP